MSKKNQIMNLQQKLRDVLCIQSYTRHELHTDRRAEDLQGHWALTRFQHGTQWQALHNHPGSQQGQVTLTIMNSMARNSTTYQHHERENKSKFSNNFQAVVYPTLEAWMISIDASKNIIYLYFIISLGISLFLFWTLFIHYGGYLLIYQKILRFCGTQLRLTAYQI